jgi:hypothetical protein
MERESERERKTDGAMAREDEQGERERDIDR